MKLQFKINIRFLLFTVVVFGLSGIVFYIILGQVFHQNMDEMLLSRRHAIEKYLKVHPVPSLPYTSADRTLQIENYPGTIPLYAYSDTSLFDRVDGERVPYRKLVFTCTVYPGTYKVVIVQSLLESDDLKEAIFYFLLGLFLIVLVILFWVNNKLSSFVWRPFFDTLTKLQSFTFQNAGEIHFPQTGILEFNILNDTLNSLTRKLRDDFVNLKEFTENASHEIQTPLAIIKSKLETTLHDPMLSETHRTSIYAAYESAIRLSKLNEGLLLLAKIENKQFIDNAIIDIAGLLKQRTKDVEELASLKNIRIEVLHMEPFHVRLNKYLADILIHNLLSNAIRHNEQNGRIKVSCMDQTLSVSNTGRPLKISPGDMFKRFVKQDPGNESTGLGLAIANEICIAGGLNLSYTYEEGLHKMSISEKS